MKRTISFFLYIIFALTLLFAESKKYYLTISPDTSINATRILQEAFDRCNLQPVFSVNESQIGLIYTETNHTNGIVLIENVFEQNSLPFAIPTEPILDIIFTAISSKNNAYVSSCRNFQNKTVGFISSNRHIRKILQKDTSIKYVELDSKQDLFDAVANEIVDFGVIYTHQDQEEIQLPAGIFNAGICEKLSIHLYLNSEHKEEAKSISQAISDMKKDGTYKNILNNVSAINSPKTILLVSSEQKDKKINEKLEQSLESYCSKNEGITYKTINLKRKKDFQDYVDLDLEAISQIHNNFSNCLPNVIITRGLESALFVSNNYDTLFKDSPTIITGIPLNFPDTFEQIGKNKIILQESISTKETINKILELFPKTQNIFLLNDKSKVGLFWQEQIISDISPNFPELQIETNQNIPDSLLAKKISSLQAKTIILTGSIDNMQDSLNILESANAPVFGLDYTSAFEYQIGGKYSNAQQHFDKALNIADSILKGIPLPATASLIKNPQDNKWIFNYSNLSNYFRFPSLLKQIKDTEIKNKPQPLFKRTLFKTFLAIFLLVLLVASVVLLIFMLQKIKNLEDERKNEEETYKKALAMQQMLFKTSEHLGTVDLNNNFSNQLAIVLELAAKVTDMDKASIWKVSVNDQATQPQCTLLAKWEQNQPVKNQPIGIILNIDTFFTDWGTICKTPRSVYITQAHATGLVKYQMTQNNVKARLLIPVLDGTFIWGFAVFDNTLKEIKPDKNTVEVLSIFTQIVSFNEIEHDAKKTMKEAQKAAASGINAKSKFLANISHEIRTPLNAILGMSNLVLIDKNLDSHIREYAQNINTSSRNLLGVINDIFDFSKIESGKLELIPASYDFDSLIHDVISMVRIKSYNTFLSLFIRIAPDIPQKLIGDELRVKQILLNLFTNAIKYTKEGSVTLTISNVISHNTVELIFEMQDTGIGIKPEDQTKLFNMFERLDTKRNRDIEGTGLGLAITKQLCELMGGSIDFASEYGNGSTFTAQIKQHIEDSTPIVNIEKVHKKKVLIYEPRRRHRRFLTIQLTDIGIRPIACANQQELIETLKKHKTFDYIFISPLYLARVRSQLKTLKKNIQMVVLADSEYEFSNMEDVIFLQTPVYCVQLANFFSNKSNKNLSKAKEQNPSTIYAPDTKVLVVDDNIVNLKVASGLLSIHGIVPVTAVSGFDALTVLHRQKFDIIFMDHLMPEMDGIETTHAIRKMQNDNKDAIIIALTANAMSGMKERFINEGMNDFLAKPIEKDDFDKILAKWLPENKITRKKPKKTEDKIAVHIPGIDTATGIRYAGNSLPIYIDILETYVLDATNKIELLGKALEENNIHDFTTHIHALKSASLSIGASYAGMLAERLEKAGIEGKHTFIEENANNCFETITEIIENINSFIETHKKTQKAEQSQKEEGSSDFFKETCKSIKQEAENFNIIEIQSKIETLKSFSWQQEEETIIEKLWQAADSYNYEAILETLEALSDTRS